MRVSLPGAITKITTLRDRTVRLQVDCQEVRSEYAAELFALNDKIGWFFFADQVIKEVPKDLPDVVLEKNEKSPSERLRASLFVLHSQNGGKKEDFDSFYKKQMEMFIEAVKDKLN